MTRREPALRIIERRERQGMASRVTLTDPATESSLSAGGDLTKTGTPVYTGPATVARAIAGLSTTRTLSETVGAQSEAIFSYIVIVPRGTPARRKQIVTVDASPDPELVGIHLRVVDDSGSEWSTNFALGCEAV